MRNPLRKRYLRELKGDFGKYLVIFLFMVLLISLVSGFLIADNNFKISYDEGFKKYNIEDGHLTFQEKPEDRILSRLESESELTFYDLSYFEEELPSGANIRVYRLRDQVNLECVMSGRLPERAGEIGLDRMFAQNSDIQVGDTILLHGQELTVCGFVALPDYSCLFEKNSDMMFDSINFGVGVMTPEGFDAVGSRHYFWNYAWKYQEPTTGEKDENKRSEKLLDDLEDVLLDIAVDQVQAQVDELYDRAEVLEDRLEDQFTEASDAIEEKLTDASEAAAEKAIDSLDSEEMMDILLKEAGMTVSDLLFKIVLASDLSGEDMLTLMLATSQLSPKEMLGAMLYMSGLSEDEMLEALMAAAGLQKEQAAELLMEEAAKKQGTTVMGLVAAELGTTEELLQDITDSLEDLEDEMDDVQASTDRITISKDDLKDEEMPETEMDFSMDTLKTLVRKIRTAGLYDTSDILKTIDELEKLTETEIEDPDLPEVEDYVPRYLNNAINFTGEDMGSDAAMFNLFNYIVIVILAFVFGVTTSNTIAQEAGVIGTLRASGYSRREMVLHYLTLPVLVTLIAAVIGNILGYTVFKDMFVEVYYGSYSLATYENLWNMNAFVNTTIIPIVIMVVINLLILMRKMELTPLQFLRRDLSRSHRKRALSLSDKIPFMHRFRIRILIQNIPAYATLAVGIFLGAVIVVFGTMFGPLLEDYAALVKESQLSNYQYILMDTVETKIPGAEKFCLTSLELAKTGYLTDEISVYGIEEESAYISADIPKGEVLLSNGMMDKYGLEPGDELTLEEKYTSKSYHFDIAGEYQYDAGMAVFMNREDYLKKFGEEEDYFTGYFTDRELTDLEEDDVASVITEKDLTKMADQLMTSMGEFMSMFKIFGAIMFLLLMYLMTKQIIEKNMISIAMTKILGFKTREIAGLYLVITSLVVLFSLLISIPITDAALRWAFHSYIYTMMSGYIPYVVSNNCYVVMVVMGIVSYALVCVFMMVKIGRIPKSEALKNVE